MSLKEQFEDLLGEEDAPEQDEGPETDLLDALALLNDVKDAIAEIKKGQTYYAGLGIIGIPVTLNDKLADVMENLDEFLDEWDFKTV